MSIKNFRIINLVFFNVLTKIFTIKFKPENSDVSEITLSFRAFSFVLFGENTSVFISSFIFMLEPGETVQL